MTKKQRTRAAKQGWATRRARERAEFIRRSQAAKRSWIERKEKARKQTRSQAAKQGWATRRANAAKRGRKEYVLHFDYGSQKRRNLIRFQLHIQGPGDATDAEAIAVGIAIELGFQKVQGWKFRLITWGHPPQPATNAWDEALTDLYDTAAQVGRKSVARKHPI